jgi:GNAT superfamily N-acetyltransferase
MQEPNLTITKCSSRDIPAILSVALQSYREHYLHLWEDGGEAYIKRSFSPQVIEKELAEQNSYFYLLHLDNRPVGFLKINDSKALAPYSAEICLELERIYLLEKVSGKGIGRKAMDFVVNIAKERKRKVVWLKAMDSSLAVLFYQKMGWQITGTFNLELPFIKDEWRGMLVMEKMVNEIYGKV